MAKKKKLPPAMTLEAVSEALESRFVEADAAQVFHTLKTCDYANWQSLASGKNPGEQAENRQDIMEQTRLSKEVVDALMFCADDILEQ